MAVHLSFLLRICTEQFVNLRDEVVVADLMLSDVAGSFEMLFTVKFFLGVIYVLSSMCNGMFRLSSVLS
jgi:hypothetical protein